MSMMVHVHDVGQQPRLWASSVIPSFSLELIPKPGSRTQRFWDPLLELMQKGLIFDRVYNCRELMDPKLWSPIKTRDYTVRGDEPDDFTYDYVKDFMSASTGIFGFQKLISALKGGFVDPRIIKRIKEKEHGTKHATYTGECWSSKATDGTAPIHTDYEYKSDGNRYGTILWNSLRDPYYTRSRIHASSGKITGTSYQFGDSQISKGSIVGLLRYYQSCASNGTTWKWLAYDRYWCELFYRTFDFTYDDVHRRCTVRYELETRFTRGEEEFSYISYVLLELNGNLRPTVPQSGSNLTPDALTLRMYMKCERELLIGASPVYSLSTSDIRTLTRTGGFLGSAVVGDYLRDSYVAPLATLPNMGVHPCVVWSARKRPLHEVHHHNCQQRISDLRPGIALAGHAALRDYLDIISANHLETLLELSDIGRQLPNIHSWIRLFKAVKSKRFWEAGKTLADIVSSTKLAYEFGLKPNEASTKEFVEKFDEVRAKLQPIIGEKTLYGRMDFALPEEDFGGPTIFTAHAKSLYEFNEDSILTTALSLNSVGLLPTLASIWEVQPLSFMVDWWANIKDRLAAIDNEYLVTCFQHIYTVYSYRVSTFIDPKLLELHDLQPRGIDDPRVTWYYRYPTAQVAPYGSSKYDLLSPNGVPDDKLLLGSLALQLMKR